MRRPGLPTHEIPDHEHSDDALMSRAADWAVSRASVVSAGAVLGYMAYLAVTGGLADGRAWIHMLAIVGAVYVAVDAVRGAAEWAEHRRCPIC